MTNQGTETWLDKWALIESRWNTCVKECLKGHKDKLEDAEVVRFSAIKCRGAIESLAQDIWALRDWLINDATSKLEAREVDGLVHSPEGYHIRACGDLATRVKHFRVDDRKKHLLQLKEVRGVEDGLPIVYRAVRIFQHPSDQPGGERQPTGDLDEYEDAVEMVRRAIKGWRDFLSAKDLLG